ncbi:uncharacterized protein K489DRAFT_380984 [Dissoconium aciculare CBS 342.82]|uniref:Uncharacterized protein n=1 Tax=Dissoconium aciculare CBS 342.82 TaxID=1314786 RepID=A0A6J3M5W3_9PEZI|nr:uncharacterized protein K489DRAFT_380984 [Dissoconium aciculare CBS 342.82]KAF1822237.1 hypothetical protein K489DRAFT_380984 [Dissoconium aciculare CBS 342.82]
MQYSSHLTVLSILTRAFSLQPDLQASQALKRTQSHHTIERFVVARHLTIFKVSNFVRATQCRGLTFLWPVTPSPPGPSANAMAAQPFPI